MNKNTNMIRFKEIKEDQVKKKKRKGGIVKYCI